MLSLLVIDDSSVKRRLLVGTLGVSRLPPHEVLEAATNHEAQAVLDARHVDLIVCALDSRTVDARALLKKMHDEPVLAKLPVVLVGSEPSAELLGELEALGMRGFLREPFRPEALGQLVREILRLSEPA
jgi:two-component system chemotaxis response regulator CheY